MGLFADGNVGANVAVGVVLVLEQKGIAAHEDVSQPLEDFCVVYYHVLSELLRDWKQHLRAKNKTEAEVQ